MRNLLQLNLSHNRISRIENLGPLSRLSSLNLSFNILQDHDSLVGILECPSLTNVDLTSNIIEHDDAIIGISFPFSIYDYNISLSNRYLHPDACYGMSLFEE